MYKMDNSLALNSLWKSCAGNDHQPLQKSGNITGKKIYRDASNFPCLSLNILYDQEYVQVCNM